MIACEFASKDLFQWENAGIFGQYFEFALSEIFFIEDPY